MNAPIARATAVAIVALAASAFVAPDAAAATPHSAYWMQNDAFNRDYPQVGTMVDDLGQDSVKAMLDDQTYFFADGVWYEAAIPGYVVIDPPTGIRVPSLPSGYRTIQVGDTEYFYSTGIYYLATPDGGFEVTLAPIVMPLPEPSQDETSPDTD